MLDDSFATIRAQQNFNKDFVTRPRFVHIGARAFELCPTAFVADFEIQIQAGNVGSAVWIVVDAAEAAAN